MRRCIVKPFGEITPIEWQANGWRQYHRAILLTQRFAPNIAAGIEHP